MIKPFYVCRLRKLIPPVRQMFDIVIHINVKFLVIEDICWIMGMDRPSGLDLTRNVRDTSKGCVSLNGDLRFL